MFRRTNTLVADKLLLHLQGKRIFTWYWGHEHRCVIYEQHSQWGLFGRCIGHSSFPEFRKKEGGPAPVRPAWLKLTATDKSPAALVLDGSNPYISGHETEQGPHGYVTLEFNNNEMTEFMHLADGTKVEFKK